MIMKGNSEMEYIGNILYDRQLIEDVPIVIYGAKGAGKLFLRFLQNNSWDKKVKCICDRNEDLWGMQLEGIGIVSPEEAIRKYKDAVFLVGGNRADEMLKVLFEAEIERIHLLLTY